MFRSLFEFGIFFFFLIFWILVAVWWGLVEFRIGENLIISGFGFSCQSWMRGVFADLVWLSVQIDLT